MEKKKYCGVVVLYNPDENLYSNIETYVNDVDKLYLIDNTDSNKKMKIKDNEKIHYYSLNKNMGLAYALNYGCNMALKDNYDYVLTMDQDSFFDKDSVCEMKKFIENNNNYAIVSPNVRSLYVDEQGIEKTAYVQENINNNIEKNWTMTSGSLMDLAVFKEVGGFDEAMFIDHLDIELGIKISRVNKKIIVLGKPIINQHFGNSKPKKLLWKTVHPLYASPVRSYYLFRNQKYLEKKYGKNIKKFIGVHLFNYFVKSTIFENDRLKKYKMMLKGIRDAKNGKMGKYEDIHEKRK